MAEFIRFVYKDGSECLVNVRHMHACSSDNMWISPDNVLRNDFGIDSIISAILDENKVSTVRETA